MGGGVMSGDAPGLSGRVLVIDDAPGLSGRVLVIDDEESLRVTLGAFLRDEGYEVATAADYDEAVAALEAAEVDLVLSDIILPGKSGIDVLTRVREKDPGCPVVMITGEPSLETAAEAVRLGAFEYLAKPVRRAEVVRVARQALTQRAIALENRRLERENREYQEHLEERVQEQTREIRTIAEIGRIIGSTLDIDQVYEGFAEEVHKLIPSDWVAINTVDLEGGTATLAFAQGGGVMGRRGGEPWPLEGTHTEAVTRTRMGIAVGDESPASMMRRFPGIAPSVEAGVRSSLMVPLISEDSVIGVLSLGSKDSNAYSGQDLELAGRIGNQITGAIANARLHGALEVESEQRRLSESRHRGFVEALPDMLFRISADGTLLDISPGKETDPVAQPEAFLGKKIGEVLPHDAASVLQDAVKEALAEQAVVEREYEIDQDGEGFDFEARIVAAGADEVVAIVRDVTQQRRSEEEIERLATTDPLTGLLNRRRLTVILGQAVRSVVRRDREGALVCLDLDGLKLVNDTHGHAIGDRLLSATGDALRRGIRSVDVAARTGDDEFTVILQNTGPETALRRAGQLVENVSDVRIQSGAESIGITASAGVVIFPMEDAGPEELLVFADMAMYQAKEAGRNRASLYDPSGGQLEAFSALQRARTMILDALEHDRVRLVRQPVVSVAGDRPTMYEVLVRLEDERGAFRMPSEFILQAEALDVVQRIDQRVVEGACERWRRYADAGEELRLSVNVSARSFGDEMLQFIDEQASRWGVDRQAFTVEITETAVTRGGVETETFVRGLRDRGFKVAMDDFGSGSTSFKLMRDLQFDYVKLDGSLIRDLATDALGRDFVRAVAGVALAIGAEVVAEHVQNDETMEFLAGCGVEYAQGYHLGRPEEFPLEPTDGSDG